MNDSIIIGSVIVLVFGALCYYLYSRLLYSEKRVNVMENILLDLKTASESWFVPSEEHQHFELSQSQQQEQEQEEDKQNNLHDAPISTEPVIADTLPNLTEPLAPTTGQKLSANYEAMNIKELQAEARNRNISGLSSLRRKELIEQLRKSDESMNETTSTSVILNSFMESAAPIEVSA